VTGAIDNQVYSLDAVRHASHHNLAKTACGTGRRCTVDERRPISLLRRGGSWSCAMTSQISRTICRPKLVATLAGFLLGVSALAGCTPPDGVGVKESVAPTQSGQSTSPASASGDGTPAAQARDRCNPDQVAATYPSRGRIVAESFDDMRDLGPRPGAMGTAESTEKGRPAAYVVAAGDSQAAVAARFCLTPGELTLLNEVRRYDPLAYEPDVLYTGDTLNLDPCTIATVGDVNGRSNENEPAFPLPEDC
jgi:hypothetical protein